MNNIPNLKYKTTLCHNWMEGIPCQKEHNCYFAHGQSELRKIQDNQQIIAQRNQIAQYYQSYNNYKTVYCKFFAKGMCKLGDNCTFAHQKKEKRKNSNLNMQQYQQPVPLFSSYYMGYMNQPQQAYSQMQQMQGNEYMEIIQNKNQDNGPPENIQQKPQEKLSPQLQPKSEEKKKTKTEQGSTTEKQKDDVDNQEEQNSMKRPNQYLNSI